MTDEELSAIEARAKGDIDLIGRDFDIPSGVVEQRLETQLRLVAEVRRLRAELEKRG